MLNFESFYSVTANEAGSSFISFVSFCIGGFSEHDLKEEEKMLRLRIKRNKLLLFADYKTVNARKVKDSIEKSLEPLRASSKVMGYKNNMHKSFTLLYSSHK